MNCLFIGRFQPFHLGHLKAVETCVESYDFCFIGVGSAQYHNTEDNPFGFSERKVMIDLALHDENITEYAVVAIPDIHDPPRWVDHVCSIVDDFSVVLTNNVFTKSLFEQKGFIVKSPGLFEKDKFSGNVIRERMRNHGPWKDLVHPRVYEYLNRIDAEERVRA